MTFEETLETVVDRVVRRVLREELQPELVTPAQAGALIGRSAKTICTWLKEGRLARHGTGKPLVSRKELLALGLPRRRRRAASLPPSAESEVKRLLDQVG